MFRLFWTHFNIKLETSLYNQKVQTACFVAALYLNEISKLKTSRFEGRCGGGGGFSGGTRTRVGSGAGQSEMASEIGAH